MLQSKMRWNFTYEDSLEEVKPVNGLKPLTQQLLKNRGIIDPAHIDKFLHPSLEDLHDPFLMGGMQETVDRVKLAVQQGESILVYGDYDADGVSSTTVMLEALKAMGADCDFYIPNRFSEGYGPNEDAFIFAKDSGFSVIITVDTGIAAVHEAEVAKRLGMDLIITDHHEVQETLPDAFAIIHPKTSPNYPFQELAGVGVAFKVAEALLGRLPEELLELTAIGTIADLVPLRDENRLLAYFGLKALSRTERPGLRALKEICGVDGEINEETIGFTIGPRLNAVGRLQDAGPAVELLISNDKHEAMQLAEFINQLNQERQKIVADIAKEAEEMVLSQNGMNRVIIAAKEGWNPGVLGIVASKLVRKFDRPAIVLGIDSETQAAKGSARSIDAFDLFQNCMEVRERFTHFGGHAQAAGMTLPVEEIAGLQEDLNRLAAEKLSAEDYQQVLDIAMTIEIDDITLKQIEEVNQLQPFGVGNPKPLFRVQQSPKEIRLIGSRKNHLKLQFQKAKSRLDGIAFGMGELYQKLSPQANMEVVGELGINEWNGRKNVQVMIKDLKVSEWQLFDFRGSKQLDKQIPLPENEKYAALSFHQMEHAPHNIPVLSPTEMMEAERLDGIVVLDLPNRLEELGEVVNACKPGKIFACYRIEDSAFLKTWPTRDHFKFFYGMLMKRKSFNVRTEGEQLAARRGWDKSMVDFISQVFFELEFVKMEDGLLTINAKPSQKDLQESVLYREKQYQMKVEQKLYFSTFRELKDWFNAYMESVEEEVVNGS
ncbi:single-stranded-DNA-specific exonuclease RecJ [Halobacillus salinarum]|uniref:Single-stranded-DNA-specific exonuclease RecJ n=1 Tax=Halobacillus salinarum TaxID=2932257 RepID=A0ABY4EQ00_9BACI|nr:single-stranded-DNA-specific exonuclease RecJ [Halobacillus salinarum]UOQ46279.1 single-stranded-DNA-specific exonuclease RecJ [Halobacillus salinarum]